MLYPESFPFSQRNHIFMDKQKIPIKSYINFTAKFLGMVLIIITGTLKPSGIYLSFVLAGIILVVWAIKTMKPGTFNLVPDLKEKKKQCPVQPEII